MTEAPKEMVNHPKHYNLHPSGVETIDVVEGMSFNLGNAFKYLMRAEHKGSQLQDMQKAMWYMQRAANVEVLPAREAATRVARIADAEPNEELAQILLLLFQADVLDPVTRYRLLGEAIDSLQKIIRAITNSQPIEEKTNE